MVQCHCPLRRAKRACAPGHREVRGGALFKQPFQGRNDMHKAEIHRIKDMTNDRSRKTLVAEGVASVTTGGFNHRHQNGFVVVTIYDGNTRWDVEVDRKAIEAALR